MINIAKGNLLTANVEALVNTVNTEGVMGKGIALQFKRAYPGVYDQYRHACKEGKLRVGQMHVVDLGALAGGPRWVINFPTKGHWKAKSRLVDIEAGLVDLARVIVERGIRSIAVPPLGCGNGGLAWSQVEPLIRRALEPLTDLRVELYAPSGAPDSVEMPNQTKRPAMTAGMAAVVALVGKYQAGLLEPFVRLIEVHKLMYFLQEAGEPLKLDYQKATYGPYATNLRHVLNRMEGHYLTGYGDGQDKPTQCIDVLEGAQEEANGFLEGRFATHERMERVAALIEGYEDPFGLELLGSMHWAMMNVPEAVSSQEVATEYVLQWSERKSRLMKAEQLQKAWSRLKSQKWDTESRSATH